MDEVEKLAKKLETTVKRYGMTFVLEALAVVAAIKAEHVATNLCDCALAQGWDETARKLKQAATVAHKRHL